MTYETVPYHSPPRRKDVRRWCKGRVGVLHEWAWGDWQQGSFGLHQYHWRENRCVNCGKKSTHFYESAQATA